MRARAGSAEYAAQIGTEREIRNRSGIAIKPLYSPLDVDPARYDADVGFPGQPPYTRGIYPTMHRGRTWTQRQLIGLGTPETYNARLRDILAQGASAVSLIPCNSVFRGYDMDEVDAELLGTCGVVVNSARPHGHVPRRRGSRAHVVRDERSVAVHAARVHARDGASGAVSTGARSPARRTRATTCRTSWPTTCSSASRCPARGGS